MGLNSEDPNSLLANKIYNLFKINYPKERRIKTAGGKFLIKNQN